MTTGVLLMAHGTPASTSEIAPFYTRIRRGRPPTPEQLAELEGRYAAIGGVSPLNIRTAAQVDAVRAALEARAPGHYLVSFGAKHTEPLIEEAAAVLGAAGSNGSSASSSPPTAPPWARRNTSTAPRPRSGTTPFVPVAPWYAHPSLVALLAAARAGRATAVTGRTKVIFTAHSLPERIRETRRHLPRTAGRVGPAGGTAAGLDEWVVAWQSAGRTPEPWLGPDVRDVVRQLAAERLADAVVICPIGFVSDHLEVLYDLDIEVADIAAEVASPTHARHRSTTTPHSSPRWPI